MTSPDTWQTEHDGRLAAMIEIASAAGSQTLEFFRSDSLTIDAKADSSPVTVADRQAEQLARRLITEKFPGDAIQGEEFDDTGGTSDYRWVIDPIDGTKSFVCGVPLYSTLLAVEQGGEPLAGVILIPALDEVVVAAKGQGAWTRRGNRAWSAAKVSGTADLADAVFVTSEVITFDARAAGETFRRLQEATWLTRTWGDGYGYLLVATGRADVMIDPVCNAWDVAAILPILVEAAGRFTDWKGNPTVRGGDGVGTNGLLHDAVLDCLD